MTYRNKKILKAAEKVPYCMACFLPNTDKTVVMAHSNQQRDGKGVGAKAHDYRVAALCPHCHYEIDNGKELSKDEKIELWEVAHRRTIGWLFEEKIIS